MAQRVEPSAVDGWREKISARFESKPEYLIPILQFLQEEAGYLPPEAMQAAARHLRLPTSKVYGVASFYAQFNFKPQGRNKLVVCRGTACHVRGSGPLLRDVERSLGVSAGETTPDMSFTLETVACFGACALAPVVVLNGVVYRQQSSATLKRLVGTLRNAAPASASPRKKGAARSAKPPAKKAAAARSAKPPAKKAAAARSAKPPAKKAAAARPSTRARAQAVPRSRSRGVR